MREFSVDMIPGGTQTAVSCNQFESGDTWIFALYYDGGRYSIPADAEVSITGTKPDGAAYKVAGTVTDNAVVIEVTEQMTACEGRSIAEILVESETDGTTLYSANFPLLVEPAAVQGDLSPSEIPAAITDTDGNIYYSADYIPEVTGGVPTEVRQAMKTLFEKAAYIETGLTDEVAVITAWAEATTSITVSPATASVSSASPTAQLSAVTTPAGGAVTWASSNTAVATVSNTGLVTAVGNGTATITATSGNVSASCAVTVTGFRTLTGIEAVYTQSGTVYDTASLDDLKTDLVVTGTYDDSSTETITAYTLSGTLAEGTSTITVSYGGFTDTFTVTVTHVEVGLVHYWNFKSGSLVDTVDGETTVTVGDNTEITSGTGVTVDAANDFITLPWPSSAGIVRAKVKFGAFNKTSSGNDRMIGVKNSSGSTPNIALRYDSTNGVWETSGNAYATEITSASAFENGELELVRSGNLISVIYNNQTIINEYASGLGWQYWELGGSNGSGFYTFVVESVKMYTE